MKLSPLLEASNNPLPLEFDADVLDMIDEKLESITLPNALIKERAGPRHIARTVARIMKNEDGNVSPATQLRAAEVAAGMGGLDKGREASTIQINIQGENVQLNQLFCPTR